jgi:hypothetical protein
MLAWPSTICWSSIRAHRTLGLTVNGARATGASDGRRRSKPTGEAIDQLADPKWRQGMPAGRDCEPRPTKTASDRTLLPLSDPEIGGARARTANC